jgi:hypothetical protein
VRNTVGPLAVNHSGQVPSVTCRSTPAPGVSLGQATAAIEAEAREVFPPAAGVVTSFGGTGQAFQSSQAGLVALLVLAVLVIYGILGVLYESFIHPITILSGLPVRVFGALLALFVFQQELSLYAFIGLVLPHRPREEERDHDGRLRRSRRSARAARAAGVDLRGVPRPLPPDHDDHRWRRSSARSRSPSASAPARRAASRSASPSSAGCCSRRS